MERDSKFVPRGILLTLALAAMLATVAGVVGTLTTPYPPSVAMLPIVLATLAIAIIGLLMSSFMVYAAFRLID